MLCEVVTQMYEEDFPLRLAQLRNKKGVSARDMSLSTRSSAVRFRRNIFPRSTLVFRALCSRGCSPAITSSM